MFYPIFTKVCGITGWFAAFEFAGSKNVYFRSEGNPAAFATKDACQSFCDYQNIINKTTGG